MQWIKYELDIKRTESVDKSVDEVNTLYVQRGMTRSAAVDKK
ncbi:hypothetical protein yinte0001_20850 [Yersinia intermedia ATCC 29909]|nr:hypothetical protein yinte0001_20850 [Yersinia intermedia ATCC 29909]